MKVATWNVNSIRTRRDHVLAFLDHATPDVLARQETKATVDQFPAQAFADAGYGAAVSGQKTYNGVAFLYRNGLEPAWVTRGFPDDEDDAPARLIAARFGPLRLINVYLPNGSEVGSEKFDYKLDWMRRLRAHAEDLLRREQPVVLGGDYNCAPSDDDVYDPERFAEDALCRPETRRRFRALQYRGMTEAWRALHGERHVYSYWDYGAAFHNDDGLRIDHFLLSPQAADRLESCTIDTTPRAWERASDHTPVVCTLTP